MCDTSKGTSGEEKSRTWSDARSSSFKVNVHLANCSGLGIIVEPYPYMHYSVCGDCVPPFGTRELSDLRQESTGMLL